MATPAPVINAKLPSRLHHTAYTSKNLEATRHFYEDIIGLPLVATWCEKDELFGKERTYCHCFFALADGGALAFFQFADKEDADLFSPPIPPTPFHHIALNVDRDTQKGFQLRQVRKNLGRAGGHAVRDNEIDAPRGRDQSIRGQRLVMLMQPDVAESPERG